MQGRSEYDLAVFALPPWRCTYPEQPPPAIQLDQKTRAMMKGAAYNYVNRIKEETGEEPIWDEFVFDLWDIVSKGKAVWGRFSQDIVKFIQEDKKLTDERAEELLQYQRSLSQPEPEQWT